MSNSRKHKYHYIYKTTCSVTGRYYIGMHSTDNLEDGYIGSGRRLWLSINKHGLENHFKEILEFLESREALKDREFQLVNEDTLKDPMCMNLQLGDEGGFCGKDHEVKCHKGASDWLHKKWNDPIYKEAMIQFQSARMKKLHALGKINQSTFTAKLHSKETKNKIGEANSISQRGSRNSQYGTIWVSHENFKPKKIKSEQFDEYQKLGWIRGRKRFVNNS